VTSELLPVATRRLVISSFGVHMLVKSFVFILCVRFYNENLKFIPEFVCLVFSNSHFHKISKFQFPGSI